MPTIVQHVRNNFGPVLGPFMETQVFRRGWLALGIEDLHIQLRENSEMIFHDASKEIGMRALATAIEEMLHDILSYAHAEPTATVVRLRQQNPLPILFYAMLDPMYLKYLVENAHHASHVPQTRSAQQARSPTSANSPTDKRGARSPVQPQQPVHSDGSRGAQTTVSPPFPRSQQRQQAAAAAAAAASGNSSGSGNTSPTPSGGGGSSLMQQQNEIYAMQNMMSLALSNTSMNRAFSNDDNDASGTAAPQQQQQSQQPQQNSQPQQQQQWNDNQGNYGGASNAKHQHQHQPAQPVPRSQQLALQQLQLQQQQQQQQQVQQQVPNSPATEQPYSPLAAAFSKPRSAPSTAASSPSAPNAAVDTGVPGARGKHTDPTSGFKGRVPSSPGQPLSWADTAEDEGFEVPLQEDPELWPFLEKLGMSKLYNALARFKLAELRSWSPNIFEANMKKYVCSAAMRKALLDSLHPNGKYPPEPKPQAPTTPQKGAKAPAVAVVNTKVAPPSPATPTAASGFNIPAPRSSAHHEPEEPRRNSAAGIPAPRGTKAMQLLKIVMKPNSDAAPATDSALKSAVLNQCRIPGAQLQEVVWNTENSKKNRNVLLECPIVSIAIPATMAEPAFPQAIVVDGLVYKVHKVNLVVPQQQQQAPPPPAHQSHAQPPQHQPHHAPHPAQHRAAPVHEPEPMPRPSPKARPKKAPVDVTPVEHSAPPQRRAPKQGEATPLYEQTCRYFLQGNCARGSECKFKHTGDGSQHRRPKHVSKEPVIDEHVSNPRARKQPATRPAPRGGADAGAASQ